MKKRKLNRIAIVLKEVEVSQKSLAQMVDVSDTHINMICLNKSQPSLDLLFRIAEALKVNVRMLLVAPDH